MPTILDYESMAFYNLKNFSKVPLRNITKHISHVLHTHNNPQLSAIKFYTLNHLVSVIKSNSANDIELYDYNKVYEAYNQQLLDTGLKIFYYLLCICVREARHLGSIKDKYKESNACKLLQSLKGKSGSVSVTEFISNTNNSAKYGNVTIGELIDLLMPVFYDHSWSSSFGGEAWGNITTQLQKYVNGDCSLEILVDTAFTLSHNTGNIFNKGIIYENNTSKLIEVLDVQRSGQMPEYVATIDFISSDEKDKLLKHIGTVSDFQVFATKVDWQKVNDLGALNDYSHKIPTVGKTHHPKIAKLVPKGSNKSEFKDTEMVTIYSGFTLAKALRKKKDKGIDNTPVWEDAVPGV